MPSLKIIDNFIFQWVYAIDYVSIKCSYTYIFTHGT